MPGVLTGLTAAWCWSITGPECSMLSTPDSDDQVPAVQ
jgi:hypothetical protein